MHLVTADFQIKQAKELSEKDKDNGWFALTPDSYAWIRRKAAGIKNSMTEGYEASEHAATLLKRFAVIQKAALDTFGKAALEISCLHPSGKDYSGEETPLATGPVITRINELKMLKDEFMAGYIEWQIEMPSGDRIFIVPELTGKDRKELTINHFFDIAGVLLLFPGAKIIDLVNKERAKLH